MDVSRSLAPAVVLLFAPASTAAGDEGTAIACLRHLPDDWGPGGI